MIKHCLAGLRAQKAKGNLVFGVRVLRMIKKGKKIDGEIKVKEN